MSDDRRSPAPKLSGDELRELNRQLQERVSGLAALHRVTLALSSTRRPRDLLRLVVEEAVEMLKANSGVVYLVEASSQKLVPQVAVGGDLAAYSELSLDEDDSLVVEAAQSRYHRVSSTIEQNSETAGEAESLRLAVPLIVEGRSLGVVSLHRVGRIDLSPIEEELLWLLAGHAAQVLHNFRLYEELELSYREQGLLYEVQQELVSAIDYHQVLNQIVQKLRALFKAKDCTIRLVRLSGDERIMRIEASAGRRPAYFGDRPLEGSAIDREVMSGNIVVIPDLLTDPRFTNKEFAREREFASMISAPLRARDKIIGTLRIYTGEPREFSLEDRKLLSAVAAQAAVAIHNAYLYRQIERKNEELSESYRQLEQTQKTLLKKEKLALLGEMAATVAHEIRNPLTAIRGFAQRIARKMKEEDKVCNYCCVIVEEVDRLNRVIADVLDFSRQAPPSLEPLDLNAVCSETIRLLQEELVENEITLVPSFDLDLPKVSMDVAQFKQVLLNLVQNARQAMERDGTLTIATERQDDWVVLSVSDTGVGIPEDRLDKIWEPFYTTRTHGTGLGLALARRIVEEHGGRVEVQSRPGEGATFQIFLPALLDEPASNTPGK